MDPILIVISISMALGAFGLIFLIGFFGNKIIDGNQRKAFQKISREYGLSLDCQKYTFGTPISQSKFYVSLSMTGSVHGHMVKIEGVFATRRSLPWGMVMAIIGRGFSMLVRQTEMTVDGEKKILYSISSSVPSSYQVIKTALDHL